MVDNLVQKLEFPHRFIKLQGVEQLLASVKKKLRENQRPVQELQILWESCCDPKDYENGYACADVIVSLVGEGLQDGNTVISTAVNYLSSSSCVTWLLHIVGQLLKLHVLEHVLTSKDKDYICPYTMRAPPHPFISIITSRPNSCNEIQAQIEYLLLDCDEQEADNFSELLLMLKPAIVYILSNPTSSMEQTVCRSNMLKFLFGLINSEKDGMRKKQILSILFPALMLHTPTKTTIAYYPKATALLESSSFTNSGVLCYLKLMEYCMQESCICDKVRATKLLKHMVTNVQSKFIHQELVIVAIGQVLSTHQLSICYEMLTLLEALLSVKAIVDVPLIYLHFVKTMLLQIQLILSLKATEQRSKHLLRKVFGLLDKLEENDLGNACDQPMFNPTFCHGFSTEVMSTAALLIRITNDHQSATCWLESVRTACTNRKTLDKVSTANLMLTLLLFHMKFTSRDESPTTVMIEILQCLKNLAKDEPYLSYSILPVLLYCMKDATPKLLQEVYYVLPSLVGHPYCVAPILNILKSLSLNKLLKPLALRLMIEVWRSQDRCYPQLQKMISSFEVEGVWQKEESNDFILVKSLAVRTICAERSHQYGGDMLNLITAVLQQPPSGEVCTVLNVSLALDALYHLCLNKALNITTTWNQFEEALRKRSERLVVSGMLNFLSLVPNFKVDTPEYDVFRESVLSFIWNNLNTEDWMVVGAVLGCLSNFDMLEFKIKHLPNYLMPAKPEDIAEDEFLNKSVPGSCYKKLLHGLSDKNLEHCEKFLSAMLRQELNDLPRDIHHRAMRSQLQASQPKPLKGIAEFIMVFYERNKQPSMKSSLAKSLLMCYTSAYELDSSGNPTPKSLVSEGRKIMNIMKALLKEVTIEPHNWQSILWCAHGWKVFMKKCVDAMVKGRRAELSMQKSKGDSDADTLEEIEQKHATALLWCRDQITNALKNASKGNPNMQGNAVFALASLISVVNIIEDKDLSADAETADSEYLKMDHWTTMAVDTVMSISNPKHIPSGRIMSWCQYRAVSSSGSLSTTQLGRTCAIHALSFVASASMQKHSGKVLEMLVFLKKGDKESEENIAFHHRVSLGHMLSVMYRENLVDQFSSEGLLLVKDCLDLLHRNLSENSINSESDLGSLLGYGLAVSSKFQTTDQSFNAEAKATLSNLKSCLDSQELSSDGLQAISMVLVWTHLSAIVNNVLDFEQVRDMVKILCEAVQEDPAKAGLCESLGSLCNGLFLCGDTTVKKVMDTLFEQWLRLVSNDKVPTREKIAALAGLGALVGANSTLSPIAVDPTMIQAGHYLTKLSNVVKSFRSLSRNSTDPGIPSRATILLGHLYMSLESNCNAVGGNVPSSYDYLPNTSLLKYCFLYLVESVSSNPSMNEGVFRSVFKSISDNAWNVKLPPVNWTSLMSSILLSKLSDETKNLAFGILLSQSDQSSICASLLSTWLSSQKFFSLSHIIWVTLYRNLDIIARCQEDLKFAELLEMMSNHCTELVVQGDGLCEMICSAFFEGLIKTMKVTDSLAPSIRDMLSNSIEGLFLNMPFSCNSKSHIYVLKRLSNCIEFLSDANALVERFEEPGSVHGDCLKSFFVRCCCTVNGSHTICMCNDTMLLCGGHEDSKDDALWMMTVCLKGAMSATPVSIQIQWMQELMGQTKKLVEPSNNNKDELVEYFINIICIAVAIWSSTGCFFPISGDYEQDSIYRVEKMRIVVKESRLLFPKSITCLFASRKWDGMVQPIVDWLVLLLEKMNDDLKLFWRQPLIGALSSMKQTKLYQLPSVWCKVVSAAYGVK